MARTRSPLVSTKSFHVRPSTSPRLLLVAAASSLLSLGPCSPPPSFSLFLSFSLARSLSSSRITCGSFSARGTRPPRSSRRGTGPTPRLFQTHFNSLPGSASAEWRADKCAVREHRHDEALRERARESRNINMKIRARGAIIPRIRS